jgi:hypothetical protein
VEHTGAVCAVEITVLHRADGDASELVFGVPGVGL